MLSNHKTINRDLLAIDVGNTTVEFAVFKDNNIIKKVFCDSKPLDLVSVENALEGI